MIYLLKIMIICKIMNFESKKWKLDFDFKIWSNIESNLINIMNLKWLFYLYHLYHNILIYFILIFLIISHEIYCPVHCEQSKFDSTNRIEDILFGDNTQLVVYYRWQMEDIDIRKIINNIPFYLKSKLKEIKNLVIIFI